MQIRGGVFCITAKQTWNSGAPTFRKWLKADIADRPSVCRYPIETGRQDGFLDLSVNRIGSRLTTRG